MDVIFITQFSVGDKIYQIVEKGSSEKNCHICDGIGETEIKNKSFPCPNCNGVGKVVSEDYCIEEMIITEINIEIRVITAYPLGGVYSKRIVKYHLNKNGHNSYSNNYIMEIDGQFESWNQPLKTREDAEKYLAENFNQS